MKQVPKAGLIKMTGKCILESWNTLAVPIFSYSVKGENLFHFDFFFFGGGDSLLHHLIILLVPLLGRCCSVVPFISLITNPRMLISRDIIMVIKKKNLLMGHSRGFFSASFIPVGRRCWPVDDLSSHSCANHS